MSKLNQRKDVTAEILVGAFMFTILAVLLTVTVVISQNKLFEKSYHITANFPTVGGLREGEEVFLRGVKVGHVEAIEIRDQENGVYVDMRLTRDVTLYEDYEVTVEVASMLGGMRVMINEGDETLPALPESAYDNLDGASPRDVLALAADAVEEIRGSLVGGGTLDNIQELSKNMAEISRKIADGEGTVGRLIHEEGLYAEAEKLVMGLNEASADLNAVMADAKDITARIKRGEGTLGRLLAEDETLYRDLEATVANARKVSQDLAEGRGVLGKLLNGDDQLYRDLRDTVSSLRTFSEDLASQDGTVGRLINDETLYIKVESLVDEARATIDDFRETSPITTFSSIFFGAF